MNDDHLEQELQDLLGAAPRLPEERLRRVRLAVYARLEQPALPAWLRWRTALPAAAALLLLGGVLGWTLGERIEDGSDLAGTVLSVTAGGL
jgi:hypothetical protein